MLATFTTVLRALLVFDETRRKLALSFAAPLLVIAFVAPGLSELLGLRQEGASMCGAILGIVARPLIEALMQLARALRDEARGLLRAWIRKAPGVSRYSASINTPTNPTRPRGGLLRS